MKSQLQHDVAWRMPAPPEKRFPINLGSRRRATTAQVCMLSEAFRSVFFAACLEWGVCFAGTAHAEIRAPDILTNCLPRPLTEYELLDAYSVATAGVSNSTTIHHFKLRGRSSHEPLNVVCDDFGQDLSNRLNRLVGRPLKTRPEVMARFKALKAEGRQALVQTVMVQLRVPDEAAALLDGYAKDDAVVLEEGSSRPPLAGRMLSRIRRAKEQKDRVARTMDGIHGAFRASRVVDAGQIKSVSRYAPFACLDIAESDVAKLEESPLVAGVFQVKPRIVFLDVAAAGARARTVWNTGYNGNGAIVAHVENGGRIQSANPYFGSISAYQPQAPISSHATECAGVIASQHKGYQGLAYGCVLLSASAGSEADEYSAVEWAIDQGAMVLNSSQGNYPPDNEQGYDDLYYDYIARYSRVLVVQAAGNNDNGDHRVASPGRGYNVLTVGNVSHQRTVKWADDAMSADSSYVNPDTGGEKPEIAAAGGWLMGTLSEDPWIGAVGSGTSFAAPLVASIAALIIDRQSAFAHEPEVLKAMIMASGLGRNIEGASRMSEQDGAGCAMATAVNCGAAAITITPSSFDADGNYEVPYDIPVNANDPKRIVLVYSQPPSAKAANASYLFSDLDMELTVGGVVVAESVYTERNAFEIIDYSRNSAANARLRIKKWAWNSQVQSLRVGIAWVSKSSLGTQPDDDAYESNNSAANAYRMPKQTWLNTIAGYGIASDSDWYRISIGSGAEHLVARCKSTDTWMSDRLRMQLFDANGVAVAESWDVPDAKLLEVNVASPGDYYLVVSGASGFGFQGLTYDLWWDSTTPTDNPNRPVNVAPPDQSFDRPLTVELKSSPFTDSDGDTHFSSQWRICRDDTGQLLYEDAESREKLTSWTLPIGMLRNSVPYRWQVRYKDSRGSWSAYSAATRFTTVAPSLISIAVSGPSQITEGHQAAYTCTAYYSDGSSAAVTPNWSENSAYASIGMDGTLAALSVSQNEPCRVTASYGGFTAWKDVTIKDVTLTGIQVSGPVVVNENSHARYTCTASYSDGSSEDVSYLVSWSENSFYASIDGGGDLAAGYAPGDQACRVTATFQGLADYVDVTIKDIPATLSSLAISGPVEINEKTSAQLGCTAHYSDGTSEVVTARAQWSVNSPYASVDSGGYLTTVEVSADQTCRVTAVFGDRQETSDIVIRDVPAVLMAIRIEGPAEFDEGATVQFECSALYSDGSASNLTPVTTWDITNYDFGYVQLLGGGTARAVQVSQDQTFALRASAMGLSAITSARVRDVTADPLVAWGNNWVDACVIPQEMGPIMGLAAGDWFSLAVLTNGHVRAWTKSGFGWHPCSNPSNFNPGCDLPTSLTGIWAVAAGRENSMALRDDGTIVTWSLRDDAGCTASPPMDLNNCVAGAAGANYWLGLDARGELYGWGGNTYDTGNEYGQLNIPWWRGPFKAIAAEYNYALALTIHGTVLAWGDNTWGQCDVPGDLSNVVAISTANGCSYAVTTDGRVRKFGTRFNNEYGNDLTAVPPAVSNAVDVWADRKGHVVAKIEGGSLVSWGSPDIESVPPSLTNAQVVAPGTAHFVAYRETLAPSIPRVSTTNVLIGESVYYQVQVHGASSNFWVRGLPPGLSIDKVSGLISGQPTTPGYYNVVLGAANEYGVGTQLAGFAIWSPASSPGTHYVAPGGAHVAPYTNWAGAATNILSAMRVANEGETVLVSNGVYDSGSIDMDNDGPRRVVVKRQVALRSVNGPQFTAIVGNSTTPCVYLVEGAVLSGFTLRDGHASGQGGAPPYWNWLAGGVLCETNAAVSNCVITGCSAGYGGAVAWGTVVDCVISGNQAEVYGGGLYASAVSNCTIVMNGGGGMYDGTADNCTFIMNTNHYNGGGVVLTTCRNCMFSANVAPAAGAGSGGNFVGCTFVDNRGGGYGGALSGGTASNCVFRGNRTDVTYYGDGGAVHYTHCYNSLFESNSARRGGAAFKAAMSGCTVVRNTASERGGGLCTDDDAYFTIKNSILYSNSAPEGPNFARFSSIPTNSPWYISFSCTTPKPSPGSGCITNNPRFAGWATGDYRLQSNSPCINTGSQEVWMAGTQDLDGKPRILAGQVDLGAFEYGLLPPPAPVLKVLGRALEIAPGGMIPSITNGTDYGELIVRAGGAENDFEIMNAGNAALSLSGSPMIGVLSTHGSDFTVQRQPAGTTMGVGSRALFSIRFDPQWGGVRTAMVSIASTDSTRNPFVFAIRGTGIRAPGGLQPHAIPGTIQAEDYDDNGAGFSYQDSTTANEGGAYRSDAVDIGYDASGATSNRNYVGWTKTGEWLAYSFASSRSGAFDVGIRVAANSTGGVLQLELDGTNIVGALAVPNTGGWLNWTTMWCRSIDIVSGTHTGRLVLKTQGASGFVGNIDLLEFAVVEPLVVQTAHGGARPPGGTNWYPSGTALSGTVTNSPLTMGSTQVVCEGWMGTGCVPSTGVGTNTGEFVLTNGSSLAWAWATNYWLRIVPNGSGALDVGDRWCRAGTSIVVSAVAPTNGRFTGWAGQTNGCIVIGSQIKVVMDQPRVITANFVRQYSLTVTSPYGHGTPEAGTHWYDPGTSVIAIMTNSPILSGTTQFVCSGWIGSGGVPVSGTGTNSGAITLTNDSSITWLWLTNYWLHVGKQGGGSVGTSDTWVARGGSVWVSATPERYFHFSRWQGQTNGCGMTIKGIAVAMYGPRAIEAIFGADISSNGLPTWWLVQYGLTNSDFDATRDLDGDGMTIWEEWVAGSNPTNRDSKFSFEPANRGANGKVVIRWPSISNRLYNLSRSTNLCDGQALFVIPPDGSNIIATPTINSYTDNSDYAVGPVFYRVTVKGGESVDLQLSYPNDARRGTSSYLPASSTWYTLAVIGVVTEALSAVGTDCVALCGDYDGDGESDSVRYKTSQALWYIHQSGGGIKTQQWGWSTTIPVPADYDGDKRTDIAVYDPAKGDWYILASSNGQWVGGAALNWGWSATIPVPGDYDGDKRTDRAVFYPASNWWYILKSSDGQWMNGRPISWGTTGCVPCPGDFDQDGRTDIAVYLPSTGIWSIRSSITTSLLNNTTIQFGWSASHPTPVDADGDGRTDICVYHRASSMWYVRDWSSGGYMWGFPAAMPVTNALPVHSQYNINRAYGLGP